MKDKHIKNFENDVSYYSTHPPFLNTCIYTLLSLNKIQSESQQMKSFDT